MKSRVDPSASVSKPGMSASGPSPRRAARVGLGSVFRFGVDQPYPVAGTTTCGAPDALSGSGAEAGAPAVPFAESAVEEPAALDAGAWAKPTAGTRPILAKSAASLAIEPIGSMIA